MPTPPEIAVTGALYAIEYAVMSGNSFPVRDFLMGLRLEDQTKIFRILQRCADFGPLRNSQQMKALGDGLFEFKANQVRVFCCYDASRQKIILLLHAIYKKSQKTPKRDLERARELRDSLLKVRQYPTSH